MCKVPVFWKRMLRVVVGQPGKMEDDEPKMFYCLFGYYVLPCWFRGAFVLLFLWLTSLFQQVDQITSKNVPY